MSRKIFDEAIRKKADRNMKSWPSKKLFEGPSDLLAKRLAKGIKIELPADPSSDPVYEATAALTNPGKDLKENG